MDYAAYDYKKTTAAKAKKRKIIAFGWYGGKYSLLKWLLPGEKQRIIQKRKSKIPMITKIQL